MSIKVTVETKPKKANKNKFPCLMRSIDGVIVLFTDEDTGTVVESDGRLYAIGDTGFDWDWEYFIDFDGKITLENK